MGDWSSHRANRVLAALLRIGWRVKRERGGSHKTLAREGWPDYTWAFHERVEVGPTMMKKIAKQTGLTPDDV